MTDTAIGRDTCARREPSARERYERAAIALVGLAAVRGEFAEHDFRGTPTHPTPYRRARTEAVVSADELPQVARQYATVAAAIVNGGYHASVWVSAWPRHISIDITIDRMLDPTDPDDARAIAALAAEAEVSP